MAAFEKGPGFDPSDDPVDILSQMFGGMGGMPGMPGMGGRGRGPKRPAKGADVEQPYEVTLEDLYKGKTTKFANKKKVICSHCKGKGGKESAKSKTCESCKGHGQSSSSIMLVRSDVLLQTLGIKQIFKPVTPGLVGRITVDCDTCHGTGSIYKDKDKCKKCKGLRTTEERKNVELYIPRGSKSVSSHSSYTFSANDP